MIDLLRQLVCYGIDWIGHSCGSVLRLAWMQGVEAKNINYKQLSFGNPYRDPQSFLPSIVALYLKWRLCYGTLRLGISNDTNR